MGKSFKLQGCNFALQRRTERALGRPFGRDEEVRKFLSCVDKERMIIVAGLRRVGKPSLVLAGLNSLNRGYIFIDVRKIYDNVSRRVASDNALLFVH